LPLPGGAHVYTTQMSRENSVLKVTELNPKIS